jgi:hypothetical protein
MRIPVAEPMAAFEESWVEDPIYGGEKSSPWGISAAA